RRQAAGRPVGAGHAPPPGALALPADLGEPAGRRPERPQRHGGGGPPGADRGGAGAAARVLPRRLRARHGPAHLELGRRLRPRAGAARLAQRRRAAGAGRGRRRRRGRCGRGRARARVRRRQVQPVLQRRPRPRHRRWRPPLARAAHDLALDLGRLLLDRGDLADVRFAVEGGARELRAHSQVLCARSPVFSAMLSERGAWAEGASGALQLEGVSAEALERFLEYLYTGSCGLEGGLPADGAAGREGVDPGVRGALDLLELRASTCCRG
ncbi:unnamed protein product, partial [Prorocentrum cordatum]